MQSFVKSFKIPAVIIRLNNVMGPHQVGSLSTHEDELTGDSFQRVRSAVNTADITDNLTEVIPKFINLLRRKRPLLLHGDGLHTRRYLYAGDAAEAFDTIMHRGTIGEVYNVDSEYEHSNLEVAQKLLHAFGITDQANWIQHTKNRAFNDRRYAVDGTKLRKLGWQQRTHFDEALAITVDWYNRFPDWWGDVEGVLSAHPVVEGDHLLAENGKSEEDLQSGDAEAEMGAVDERAAKVTSKLNGHAEIKENGVGAASGKKRKIEEMSEA